MASTRSTFQTSSNPSETKSRRIVFFDGYCSLCNQWVDFLLRVLTNPKKESTHYSFQLASLQGNTAREILKATGRSDLLEPPFNTIVLYERVAGTVNEVVFFTESDAILRIFAGIGSPWSIMAVFRFLPRFIRDGIYRLIARKRYQWFGKRDTCRLPTKEESAWLLD